MLNGTGRKGAAKYGYKNNPFQKISGRYTVDKVVMLHVEGYNPKLYYVILNGPRGGKVFCDPLNIEDIFVHKYGLNFNNVTNAIVSYGMKTNKIEVIYATQWDVFNDKSGLRMAKISDRNTSQKLIGRVYKASEEEYLRNKIFNALYIEPDWNR